MRLRFWRAPECPEPQPSEDARAALVHARRQQADTERFSERVEEVADQLAGIARRNHIAEAIIQAIRGG